MISLSLILKSNVWNQAYENKNDIIVNEFLSIKETELNSSKKTLQSKMFTIEQVINECATYDIIDVTGLVYNLKIEAEHEKDGKPLLT